MEKLGVLLALPVRWRPFPRGADRRTGGCPAQYCYGRWRGRGDATGDGKAIAKGPPRHRNELRGQPGGRDTKSGDTPGRVDIASHPGSEVAGLWVGGVDGGKRLAPCPRDVDNRACPFGQTGCLIDDTAGVVAANRQARTGRPVEGKLLARLVTVLLALQDQVDFLADQQIQ